MKKNSIYLVEDDESFGSVLQSYLEMNHYTVFWVSDGERALREFTPERFDLCILDIMLPHLDGFSLAREIKTLQPGMPLIFLTAKTLKQDILQGYGLGADDYITKPFDSEVLLCKIRAILNRRVGDSDVSGPLDIGRYTLDQDQRVLKLGEEQRKLSPKEGQLLKLLAEHRNTVLNREKALKQVWGQDDYFTGRSMDVYITRLRKYLKDDPSISIENVHGSGYVLKIRESAE